MGKKNTAHDVFKNLNMHMGDLDECWEWTGKFNKSDQRPYFTVDGKRRPAYCFVIESVTGVSQKEGQVVRHTCDNGTSPIGCCNPSHLVFGSHQDNMNDMKDRDRHGLPKTVVRSIKKLIEQGRTQQDIAELYGVSREAISAINTGRNKST